MRRKWLGRRRGDFFGGGLGRGFTAEALRPQRGAKGSVLGEAKRGGAESAELDAELGEGWWFPLRDNGGGWCMVGGWKMRSTGP